MKPNDYIQRKDNKKITAIIILMDKSTMLVQGPYGKMTVKPDEWEKVNKGVAK